MKPAPSTTSDEADSLGYRTLLEKLVAVHAQVTARVRGANDMVQVPLTLSDLWSLICMLRDDQVTSGVGYYQVTHQPPLQNPSSYSVTGPGLYGVHEMPSFAQAFQAEAMARCLSRALIAGQRMRSAELRALLDDGRK